MISTEYNGYTIVKNEDGTFAVPELDSEVHKMVDVLKTEEEAENFIDWYLATY